MGFAYNSGLEYLIVFFKKNKYMYEGLDWGVWYSLFIKI